METIVLTPEESREYYIQREHERLKQAVVEAAKARRVYETTSKECDSWTERALNNAENKAVDALNKYEAEMNSEV